MLRTLVCRRDPVLILFKSKTPSKAATTPVTKQMSASYLKKGQKIQLIKIIRLTILQMGLHLYIYLV